jgi:hypothetical protein
MDKCRKILTSIFSSAILAMTVLAPASYTGQKAWAATGILANNLLPDSSDTWKIDTSDEESPDHRWLVEHPGYNFAQVVVDDSNREKILQLKPKLDDNLRHSTLVIPVNVSMIGIHGKTQVRLDQQSSIPKPWDSFWIGLAWVDKTAHISLLIRTADRGWEVAKRDHDHVGEDLHVPIAQGLSIAQAEIGHWYNVEWWIMPHNGTLHIKVVVDGTTLVDKDDTAQWDRNGQIGNGTSNYFLNAPKTFAAYCEKSHTSWRQISVESIS